MLIRITELEWSPTVHWPRTSVGLVKLAQW